MADPRIEPAARQPVFYYDLGSPSCYLAAEQIIGALPVVPEWEPVPGAGADEDRAQIEHRAGMLGLQRIRWPARWPPDSTLAIRAATYAKRVGRGVAFSLAAFRQAFAGGRDLGDPDTVLIAAAACEMHPAAVLKGVTLRSVQDGVAAAADRARLAGVRNLPAIQVGDHLFEGSAAIDDAARALEEGG